MKKLIGILMLLVIMATSAFATADTGFHLDNKIDVTGDWKWDNGWQQGEFKTAEFNMKIDSADATQASFSEVMKFGSAWQLDYDSEAFVNKPTKFENELMAITVNPVDTTPGTAWTKVHYKQMSGSEFSQSNLKVNGFGDVYVKSTIRMENAGGQTVDLNIN